MLLRGDRRGKEVKGERVIQHISDGYSYALLYVHVVSKMQSNASFTVVEAELNASNCSVLAPPPLLMWWSDWQAWSD